jgi:hypothetical protein
MTHYVGLDVSQKETTICVVDEQAAASGAVRHRSIPRLLRRSCASTVAISRSELRPVR